jgi:hypothetical protein
MAFLQSILASAPGAVSFSYRDMMNISTMIIMSEKKSGFTALAGGGLPVRQGCGAAGGWADPS